MKNKSLKQYWLYLKNRLADKTIDAEGSPIFVMGCSHSGTTLMMALLARHPDCHVVAFESGVLLPESGIEEIRQFYTEQSGLAGGKRLVEKTPRHVFAIPRLFRLFPNARAVVMLRDGRDVAVSIRRRKGTLHAAMNRWMEAAKSLEPWVDDKRMHIVRYESLVTEPRETLASLVDFLEMSVDIEQLMKTEVKVDFKGAKDNLDKDTSEANEHLQRRQRQINQDIYDDRGRWKTEMTEDEQSQTIAQAGSLLRRWGYL